MHPSCSNYNDKQILQIVKHLYRSMQSQQNQRLIDLDHLNTFKREQIKPLYPHKYIYQNNIKKLQKFSCSDICCDLSSGSNVCGCCMNIQPPDKYFSKFGLGANIYFTFMRHFSIVFIIIAFLSLVSVGICYFIGINNGINSLSNYQIFFFSTTMGSISSSNFRCKYSNNDLSNTKYEFELKCESGRISKLSAVYTTYSQQSISNCKLQQQKHIKQIQQYTIDSSLYTQTISTCSDNFCKIKLDFFTPVSPDQLISYPYSCIQPVYYIANTSITNNVFVYVIVGIDLLITVILIMFFCCQIQGESKQIQHFKKYQLNLSDFSLKIKGFNKVNFHQEYQNFIQLIKKSTADQSFDQKIIQIKLPDDQSYIQSQQQKRQVYQQLKNFMSINFFDNLINPLQYNTQKQFRQNVFNSAQNYLLFKTQLVQLIQKYKQCKKKYLQCKNDQKDEQIFIYMVMSSGGDITYLKRAQTKSCFDEYILVPQNETKSKKTFKKYWIEQAPVPDMLQWHNKGKYTCLRLLISWLITLIIVGGSYILFGFIQYQQNVILSQYNFSKMNCQLLYSSSSVNFNIFDQSLYNTNQIQYTHCYCSKNYFGFNLSDEVIEHCSVWWKSYLMYLIIPVLISLGIILYNLLVSLIFKKITQFEGHFMITDEIFSYTIKRSFILIMNMGLIIVLLNFNYNDQVNLNMTKINFLFQGQFNDLTSDWYIKIGSIVIMTMIFNIFFPLMQLFLNTLLKCVRKCIDKRCWTKKTSQKYKSDYINLYSGDIYPIEQRYAFIISIFWITLIFNTVIPLLNIIAALSIVLLTIIDKILVFKFFKTPANYNQSLHQKFIKTLFISLMLHMVSTAFFLSQPFLIAQNSQINAFNIIDSNHQRLSTIIKTFYILPYVGLFLLLVLYALLKSTVLRMLNLCNKKIQRASMYKLLKGQNFYQSLTEYQLKRLKIMMEKEIIRLQSQNRKKNNHKNNFFKNQQLSTNQNSSMNIHPKNTFNDQIINNKKDSQILMIKRNYLHIQKQLEEYQKGKKQKRATIIGLPGYQIGLNEAQAEKDRKMMLLDQILDQVTLQKK